MMMTGTEEVLARLDAIEAPARQAQRAAELARVIAEATDAQAALPDLAHDLEVLRSERAEAEQALRQAEAALGEQRAAVARLGVLELPVEAKMAVAWRAIHKAEDAGRPVAVSVAPRRWADGAFAEALRRVFGVELFARKVKVARPHAGPALRPGEVVGTLVRFVADTTAGGVSRYAGTEAVVSVEDAEILEGAGKAIVVARDRVVPPPKPYAVRNVGPTTINVDGAPVAPGDVVMVAGETWAGVRAGRYPALDAADDDLRRIVELERQAQALG